MKDIAMVRFKANGTQHVFTFEHTSPGDDVKHITNYLQEHGIHKKDVEKSEITIFGWGFWAGLIW